MSCNWERRTGFYSLKFLVWQIQSEPIYLCNVSCQSYSDFYLNHVVDVIVKDCPEVSRVQRTYLDTSSTEIEVLLLTFKPKTPTRIMENYKDMRRLDMNYRSKYRFRRKSEILISLLRVFWGRKFLECEIILSPDRVRPQSTILSSSDQKIQDLMGFRVNREVSLEQGNLRGICNWRNIVVRTGSLSK